MHSEEKQSHVKAWQASGLTKAAYARNHDINSKTFGRWCQIYQSQLKSKPGLVPVTLQAAGTQPKPVVIKLQWHTGWVLELPVDLSPRWVGELLQCLD